MLTPKASRVIQELCGSMDISALEEVMGMVKTFHQQRMRERLHRYRTGQKVEWRASPYEKIRGVIASVNKNTLTVRIENSDKSVRISPSRALRIVE